MDDQDQQQYSDVPQGYKVLPPAGSDTQPQQYSDVPDGYKVLPPAAPAQAPPAAAPQAPAQPAQPQGQRPAVDSITPAPRQTSILEPQFLPGGQYKPPTPAAMPPGLRLTRQPGAEMETPQEAADYEDVPKGYKVLPAFTAERQAQQIDINRATLPTELVPLKPLIPEKMELAGPAAEGFSRAPASAPPRNMQEQIQQEAALPREPFEATTATPLKPARAVAHPGALEAAPTKGLFGRAWDAIRELPYPSGDGTLGREMDRAEDNAKQATATVRNIGTNVAGIPAALAANPITGKPLLTRAVDMLDALDKKSPMFGRTTPEEYKRLLISAGMPPDQAERQKNMENATDPLREAIDTYKSGDPDQIAKIQDRGLSVANVLRGMGGGARQVADGLTTPENLALMYALGSSSVPRAVRILGGMGFAAGMAKEAVQQFNLGYDAYKKGDVITATQAWTAAPADALFALLTGAHLAGVRTYEGAYGEHGLRAGAGPIEGQVGYRPAYREQGPTGSYSAEEGSRVVPGTPTAKVRVGAREATYGQPAPAAAPPTPAAPAELTAGGGENVPRGTSVPNNPAAPAGTAGEPVKPIGAVEPETERPVLQEGNNPEAIQARATEEHPEVKATIKTALSDVPGAKLAGARPEKDADRLEEKIEDEGQSSATARDYSGFRIAVDSPADVPATIAALRQRFEVHAEQDNFAQGDEDHGFHSYTLNVRAPGSDVSHEVQILPREVADAANKDHSLYEKARDGDKDAAAELRQRNDQHWQDFQARQQETATEHEFGTTHSNIPAGSDAAQAIEQARAAIPEADLAGQGKDVGGNHVTVRYGLQHDLTPGLRFFIESQTPFDATLGPVAAFPPSVHSDGAVPLHAPVESTELARLNREIEQHGDFARSNFADYKPHATIAYVKPEAAQKYVGNQVTAGKPFKVNSITVTDSKGNETEIPLKGTPDRRVDAGRRQRVAEMAPEEMRRELLTSEKTGLPNRRAFEEKQREQPAAAVAMSDADGLKAFNDRFGYAAGDELLRAKAEALRAAGLDAYHDKGDEFLYRGDSPKDIEAKLEKAREILRAQVFDGIEPAGSQVQLKGVDFSYGTGTDLKTAESALKAHKSERESQGERARGELGPGVEVKPKNEVESAPGARGREPGPGEVGSVKTSEIAFDPKRFQYKLNTDASGTTNLLKGQKWNPDLAGVISVWRDPANGKLYVVNGHHRAQHAKENEVPRLNALHLPATTAEEARATAALQNIAEGRGTAVDAAKFFRDSGIGLADLKEKGISLGEATAANGLALSRLHSSLFDKVVSGQLRIGRAVEIGNATAVPEQQEAILKLIERQEMRGRRVSDDTVAELARMASGAGEHAETQQTLFGAVEMRRNLALEKAEISAYIRDEIGRERRLFATVADKGRAATLEKGQNKINAAENAKTAETAAQDQDQEIYDRLSTRTGTVDDILNAAATELAEGKGNASEIKRRAYSAARTALAQAYKRGEGAGAEGPRTVPAGSQQVRPDATQGGRGAGAAGAGSAAAERGPGEIAKGDVVRLRDGTAGVVQYVTPASTGLVRARVRLSDGKLREAVKPTDLERVQPPKVDPAAEWIGVDLDKTLAHYTEFKGKEFIGKPIPEMVDRIRNILANGERVDGKLVKNVRFFTARVADDPTGVARASIEAWSQQHLGQVLPITNIKDPKMVKLYDDRATQVEPNTGQIVGGEDAETGARIQEAPPAATPAARASEATRQAAGDTAARGAVPARTEAGDLVPDQGRNAGGASGDVPAGARPAGRLPGETAEETQNRLIARGRYQRELSAAENRLTWDNAARAKVDRMEVDGAPVHVMNAPAYEAIRKIAFPEDRFEGVYLVAAEASRMVARVRSFESNVRVRPGMRQAAESLKALALALDQGRDADGSLLLIRGDYDPATLREELWHRWYIRSGLYGSDTMEELAAMPVFERVLAKLRELYKEADGPQVAAEIVGKALAGDPDIDWKGTEQQDLAQAALEAAIDEKGPAVLDGMPAADPKLAEVIKRAREYGQQTARAGAGAEGRGVAQPNREAVREATPRQGLAPDTAGSREPGGAGLQPGAEGTAPTRAELEAAGQGGLFQRRRPPGFVPLQGEPIAFPGMEDAVKEAEEARTAAEKQAMEEQLRTPLADIDKKAGEMERNAPLFRGSDASPQGSLFKRQGTGNREQGLEKAPTFYLKSERLIGQKMQGPMPANAALRMLENNGVKPEELEWTGLGDLLRAKGTAPVKPQELRETLAANDIGIQEVEKGGTPHQREVKALEPRLAGPVKFEGYTLPGGENYRELLLTLPSQGSSRYDLSELKLNEKDTTPTHWAIDAPGQQFMISKQNYGMSSAGRAMQYVADTKSRSDTHAVDFRTPHWEEPNVIGHVRFNDRTGPNGEKLLHLEELQSDWHQRGRTEGYLRSLPAEEVRALELRRNDLWKQLRGFAKFSAEPAAGAPGDWEVSVNGRIVYTVAASSAKDAIEQTNIVRSDFRGAERDDPRLAAITREYDEAQRRLNENGNRGVPNAPFKKTWPELLMKRMIRYAAENGYDGISWTPGEQQAARYDLSRQIESLDAIGFGNGKYDLTARMPDGRWREVELDVSEEKLADHVGKDLAAKIVAGAPAAGTVGRQTFSGLDLKVGGEGMKNFYDKIVPQTANKIGKPFGAKVVETSLPDNKWRVTQGPPRDGQPDFSVISSEGLTPAKDMHYYDRDAAQAEADRLNRELGAVTVPYLPVTDAMRESVMTEGQPLFKRTPVSEDLTAKRGDESEEEFHDRLAGLKAPRATPTTVTTGGHDTGKSLEDAIADLKGMPARKMGMGERVEAASDAGVAAVAKTGTAIEKAWGGVKGAAAGAWDSWGQPAPWTDYFQNLGDLRKAELRAAMDVDRYQKELKRVAPSERERNAMTAYGEAGGDPQTLKRWAAGAGSVAFESKPGGKRNAQAFKDALNLTPEQQQVADAHTRYYQQQLKILTDAGLLPAGASHYAMHTFATDPETLAKLRAVTDFSELMSNPSFLKRRVWPSFFDAIMGGEDPKTMDAGRILSSYHDAFTKTFMTRGFVRSLLYGVDPEDGRPLAALESRSGWAIVDKNTAGETRIMKQPKRPENVDDYVRIPASQLRNFTWELDDQDREVLAPGYAKMDPAEQAKLFTPEDPRFPVPEGKQLAMKGDIVIHPKYAGRVSDLVTRSWFESPSDHLPVKIIKGTARAVGKAGSTVKGVILYGSGFHQVQLGMHALDHFINPFRLDSLEDLTKDKTVQDGVGHGLKMVEIDPEGVLSGLPGMGAYHRYLFRDWIPRLKAKSYKIIYERNLERYGGGRPGAQAKLTRDEIGLMSAAQTNAAFSGQDPAFFRHLEVMNNRTFKAAEHLLLFSPDFTKARAQFVAQGFSKFGSEQRLALLRGAALMYAACRIINAALNHEQGWRRGAHWDPQDAFTVVTPKSWGPAWGNKAISVRTVYSDIAHLVASPAEWTYNRLNPVTIRPTIEFITGRDNFGRQETKTHFAKSYATQTTPIPVQKLFTTNDQSLIESFFTSLGANMANYHTPLEKKAHDLYVRGIPDEPESEERQAESRRNVQLSQKFRDGQISQTDLWNLVSTGKISPQDAARVQERGSMSDLQYDVKHMSNFDDAVKVWNAADASERAELSDIMEAKADRKIQTLASSNVPAATELENTLRQHGVPIDY
jgi:GGDEF domain-containing protein/2'-5' RNA ligase